MKQIANTGKNRTGIQSAAGRAEAMQSGGEEYTPSSHGDTDGASQVRVIYAKLGEGAGSVPPPQGLIEKAKAGLERLQGHEPSLLIDKLGERLAFERTGVRLYEALLSKHEAYGSFDGGPSADDLLQIMSEEHRHFAWLEGLVEQYGGDPTAVTPAANIAATASSGIMKVLTDPRTNLLQSLEAILLAELADNDAWLALGELARQFGDEELARDCLEAYRTEQEHLQKVRMWCRGGTGWKTLH